MNERFDRILEITFETDDASDENILSVIRTLNESTRAIYSAQGGGDLRPCDDEKDGEPGVELAPIMDGEVQAGMAITLRYLPVDPEDPISILHATRRNVIEALLDLDPDSDAHGEGEDEENP